MSMVYLLKYANAIREARVYTNDFLSLCATYRRGVASAATREMVSHDLLITRDLALRFESATVAPEIVSAILVATTVILVL